jgi:hypothetical protein
VNFLEDMLYEAIFVPEGHNPLPRDVLKEKSLSKYIENWGKDKFDIALVVEVDNQLAGPYRLWHHQHHFKEIPGGVEMTDILNYALPGGFLGRLMHQPLVRKRLEDIFNYRVEAVHELFGFLEKPTNTEN